MRRSNPARLLPLAALALPLLAAHPVLAQRGPMVPPTPPSAPTALPPALPGLASRGPSTAIPPDANFNNLGPTEALFDSINRGDLGAARDAVSRGADLNGRNVLGLTPIDSAVDQGRNDIAFFLLSARGPGPISDPTPPPPALAGSRPSRPGPISAPPALSAPTPRPAPRAAPAAPAARADGGAARPDVGFLGFDAGRGG
jgi:ankyrin repeat protein